MINTSINNGLFSSEQSFQRHVLEENSKVLNDDLIIKLIYDPSSNSSLIIKNDEEKVANNKLYIPINERLYTLNENWAIDLSINTINKKELRAGIMEELTVQERTEYFIWALANNSHTDFIGFCVTRKPRADFTSISNPNKGEQCELTLSGTSTNNAFQFTIGARVRIKNTNSWNYGTITKIESNTKLYVLLDSNSYYGDNITSTAGDIEQLDSYKPYSYTDSSQSLISNNFRYITRVETDNSKNLIWHDFGGSKYISCFPDFPVPLDGTISSSITGSSADVSIAKYVPENAKFVYATVYCAGAVGTNGVSVIDDIISGCSVCRASHPPQIQDWVDAAGKTRVNRFQKIRISRYYVSGTLTVALRILGYWI